MKRTAYFNPRAASRFVLAAACIFAAAACTTDDDPSRPDNDDHDGRVPLTFTAVRPAPMTDANTRAVPGKDAWTGDGTEKIGVCLIGEIQNPGGTAPTSRGTYTITSPTGTTEVLPGDQPAVWLRKSGNNTINAWYPDKDEFDISDQSTPEKFRQADLLRASKYPVSYNTTPVLDFGHQMAKVRVVLTGAAAATGIQVHVRGVPRFTLNDTGTISSLNNLPQDYIAACHDAAGPDPVAFEALLPANGGFNIIKQYFIRIIAGGRTYYFTPAANDPGQLREGRVYTYSVTLPAATTTASHFAIPAASVATSFTNR